MEFITTISQIGRMIDNKIVGNIKLTNSKINFIGSNNILVCDNEIELNDVTLDFEGNDSIVYLCSNLNSDFHLSIYNDSVCFIGKNVKMGRSITLKVLENKNIIIGDDCIFGDDVTISNSDGFPLYDISSKKRINFSDSIYIGDHVFLGDNVFISNGAKLGSGSFIGPGSVVESYLKIPSNNYASGNPVKIIQNNIFFINEFVGSFGYEESLNSQYYKSEVFVYEVVNNETLSIDKIDSIIMELDVASKREFLKKLLINNKRKNRFSIG